jgi:hypothetical protein
MQCNRFSIVACRLARSPLWPVHTAGGPPLLPTYLPTCLPTWPSGLGPLGPMQLAAAVSALLLLPLLFIDLRRLSWLSMIGLTSSGLVTAMVLSLLWLDPHRAAMPQQVRRQEACRPAAGAGTACLLVWLAGHGAACSATGSELTCAACAALLCPAAAAHPPSGERRCHSGCRHLCSERHSPLHAARAAHVSKA